MPCNEGGNPGTELGRLAHRYTQISVAKPYLGDRKLSQADLDELIQLEQEIRQQLRLYELESVPPSHRDGRYSVGWKGERFWFDHGWISKYEIHIHDRTIVGGPEVTDIQERKDEIWEQLMCDGYPPVNLKLVHDMARLAAKAKDEILSAKEERLLATWRRRNPVEAAVVDGTLAGDPPTPEQVSQSRNINWVELYFVTDERVQNVARRKAQRESARGRTTSNGYNPQEGR